MTNNITDRSTEPGDPVSQLLRLRRDVDLGDEWDGTRRDAVLADILASPTAYDPDGGWVRRHRRLVAVGVAGLAAACGVAGGLLLPNGSPGGSDAAAAAALDRLAVVAGTSGRTVGPGQYAYTDTREVQTFSAADVARGSSPRTEHTLRSWTARSGDTWNFQDGGCLRHFPHDDSASPAGGNYDGLNSAALATLPTTPAALAHYIDEHPSGDNRGTRNRFLGVGDLVRSGLATPALRAAAIRVLARTTGLTVDTRSRDALGRDAVEVDYAEGAAVESLFFAPSTSMLLEDQQRENGSVEYRGVTQASRVVESLPDRPACG